MRTFMIAVALLMPAVAAARAPKGDVDRPENAADKGDRVICKSIPKIGSLIAADRTCMTKRDWDRERNRTMGSGLGSSCQLNNNGTCG